MTLIPTPVPVPISQPGFLHLFSLSGPTYTRRSESCPLIFAVANPYPSPALWCWAGVAVNGGLAFRRTLGHSAFLRFLSFNVLA